MPDTPPRTLQTRRGQITFPTFLPVTTFGERFPLDRLIRLYLPRLSQAILVSYHYAARLDEAPEEHPDVPLFIDSGGFALLFDGARLEKAEGHFGIRTTQGEFVSPAAVLDRQMKHAEIGATLDFPIPPQCKTKRERKRRFDATLTNAEWALKNNRRPDLQLFASLQCWDADSAREAANSYAQMQHHDRRFAGIAIGGLVPRLRDQEYVQNTIEAVRDEWNGPIHVFGIGSPAMVRNCILWGADSTDSTSYVKYAANGQSLNPRIPRTPEAQLTPLGRMTLALRNLAHLMDPVNDHLPLSAVPRQLAAMTTDAL